MLQVEPFIRRKPQLYTSVLSPSARQDLILETRASRYSLANDCSEEYPGYILHLTTSFSGLQWWCQSLSDDQCSLIFVRASGSSSVLQAGQDATATLLELVGCLRNGAICDAFSVATASKTEIPRRR